METKAGKKTVKKTTVKKESGQKTDEINVKLTDEQIENLHSNKAERVVVFSVGILSFDVSPIDLVKQKVKVTVLLCGIPVGDIILDKNSLEQSIGPNIGIAKAFVTLSIDWKKNEISYKAKACIRNWRFKWKCKESSGVLKKF